MRTNTGIFKSLNLNATDAEFQNAGFHNSIYREKNITSYLNDGSLWTRISSGKFDDLFVGDYFNVTLNGTQTLMRIAGFDTFYKIGESPTIVHHAVIIPDAELERAAMNKSATTSGGYLNSTMHKAVLPKWVGYLETALGASHVLATSELLTARVDENTKNCLRSNLTGASDAVSRQTQKVSLLSETELYGYMSCSSSGFENAMCIYGQFPLFKLAPNKIMCVMSNGNRIGSWLRNVASSSEFCYCTTVGIAAPDNASYVNAVRPRFVIG